MTQEEATIIQWFVKDGDTVEFEDPLAEVTTDKVNMEVPAPAEGIIGGIRFAEGETSGKTDMASSETDLVRNSQLELCQQRIGYQFRP